MSTNVVTFTPRAPGAFADARHRAGVPARVSRTPEVLSHAAAALAELAGEDLDAITPERFDEWRTWALVAVTIADRDGARLIAYHVERARREIAREPRLELLDPTARLTLAHRLMVGLRAAARFLSGLGAAIVHDQVVALVDADRTPPVPPLRPSRLDV